MINKIWVVLKPFIQEPVRHFRKICSNTNYRTYYYLAFQFANIPRYTVCSTNLFGTIIVIPDKSSFLSSFYDIFVKEIYHFKTSKEKPIILDIGANIGLSAIYFKKAFPRAKLTAIEADPYIFSFLKSNIENIGLRDVELINAAAWNKDEKLDFLSDHADGGKLVSDNKKEGAITVQAINSASFFQNTEYDFVKIDVEGAEDKVLEGCRSKLNSVKNLFIEYHSSTNKEQSLNKIISIVTEEGFRIYLQTLTTPEYPFVFDKASSPSNGFDLQVNIFCRKILNKEDL